jgi:hypothetical protein
MLGMMLALELDSESTMRARVEADMRWAIRKFYGDAVVVVDWAGVSPWAPGCWLHVRVLDDGEVLDRESALMAEIIRLTVLGKVR